MTKISSARRHERKLKSIPAQRFEDWIELSFDNFFTWMLLYVTNCFNYWLFFIFECYSKVIGRLYKHTYTYYLDTISIRLYIKHLFELNISNILLCNRNIHLYMDMQESEYVECKWTDLDSLMVLGQKCQWLIRHQEEKLIKLFLYTHPLLHTCKLRWL